EAAPGAAAAAAAAGAGLGPPAEAAASSLGFPLVALGAAGAAAGPLEAVRAALPVGGLAALASFEACQGVRVAADDAVLRAQPPPSEAMREEVQRMLDLARAAAARSLGVLGLAFA
ncbi:unnamed protein product, partial [Prorocentrum cordatum]